ncbi:MAG: hypothetical protein IT193_14745 [Propionibacteriaceae bacterium]|nr:hypothetical protein [Propionibacteriaceae bacterium]
MTWIYHVAIADDWKTDLRSESYEAATRGVLLEPGGHLPAVTSDGAQQVLDDRYADLTLPLLLVALNPDALVTTEIPVVRNAGSTGVRIGGPAPCLDALIVCQVQPLERVGARWLAPAAFPPPTRWCRDGPLARDLTRRSRTGW